MATVKCAKCGKEIRYLPQGQGIVAVELEITEVIAENGRVLKGHLPHECNYLDKSMHETLKGYGIETGKGEPA